MCNVVGFLALLRSLSAATVYCWQSGRDLGIFRDRLDSSAGKRIERRGIARHRDWRVDRQLFGKDNRFRNHDFRDRNSGHSHTGRRSSGLRLHWERGDNPELHRLLEVQHPVERDPGALAGSVHRAILLLDAEGPGRLHGDSEPSFETAVDWPIHAAGARARVNRVARGCALTECPGGCGAGF